MDGRVSFSQLVGWDIYWSDGGQCLVIAHVFENMSGN
jgi:hypothetical protein